MDLFSLKMRASQNKGRQSTHISGAEKIVRSNEIYQETTSLLRRALTHPLGEADFINIKLERTADDEIIYLNALPVQTVEVTHVEEGLQEAQKRLEQLGALTSERILDLLLQAPAMRGAMILDIDTLTRLEPDQTRGVRATYMDKVKQCSSINYLDKNHFEEALVLATKVAHAPNIIGEICISDDPDYVTGYVASKKFGYVRITKLKHFGSHLGGRIFLYKQTEGTLQDTIRYLQEQKVLVQFEQSPKPNKWAKIDESLEQLKNLNLYRTTKEIHSAADPHVLYNKQQVAMMASNNYLNFANDERVKAYALSVGQTFGIGSGGSRLTTGTTTVHNTLEQKLAVFKGTEDALVFNSGYVANVGIISALCSKDDVIFSDELNHASIIDGCKMSQAQIVVYKHNDMQDLEEKVRQHAGCRGLIVSDAVFSMDGDIVHLPELLRIANQYELFSMIDEAHSTGVLGQTGRGICEHFGLTQKPDILMGTLSKALGGEGGFVCGEKRLIEFLKNKARSFIFSTSLSPVTMASSIAALTLLMEEESKQVQKLQQNIRYFNACLARHGIHTRSETAIFPIIIGDEKKAMHISETLLEQGYYISAIRYPTVAKGSARLRIALMADHTQQQLDDVASSIGQLVKEI